MLVDLLVWFGLVRRLEGGKLRWPIYVSPWEMWKVAFWHPFDRHFGWFCLFRNKPGVIKWQKGRLLPRRWGFRVLGLEIGDRG
jgi:hypothetical protein